MMKINRFILYVILFSSILSFSTNNLVQAEFNNLIPCKESKIFNKRLESTIKKLENKLSKYEVGSSSYLAIKNTINKTNNRFHKYMESGVLCGKDGLPHLIADGRWSHAGEFVIPSLLFIYISGWIGWVGRGYLSAIKNTNKAIENEIIIDVPLALKFMSSGFIWPLSALREYTKGDLLMKDSEVTISPR
ncbi:[pt] photosystem I subunit III [Galdieria sulphuraria]|uniref:Photosystem I reaction center subunit III n=2 Tax=Galdieria sulphuraria TaxID=130081 RepID=E3UIU5_GALSU|nr:photosystem I subunit III [Galdieria sulphuraria]XP_005705045.1 [pt] photosystem I subunit III [Galdieria sulphuraria]ADO32970.1 photosystem I subunit F [Galdieria sulphuraria]AIG92586.1 photosystem I subunit III [Galdieria sulphuraria]EME28525.1 [pt] photosystem I subunit III [Galdieria sulphuraria]|eukprot:XP_005705045.1 [pt] photosystem I subunit III [Galdieria sulphuraria]